MVSPALRQAAGIARALEGRVENRPKTGEPSDVKAALTIADSAAQEALLVPLLEHFPEARLQAEEETPSAARFATEGTQLIVVDPIDGTLRFYLERGGPYAILVGLAVEGRYEAGLVALPREGLFFDALRAGPARIARAGAEPELARAVADGRRVLVSHDLPEAVRKRLAERGFEVARGCGGAIAVAPLIDGVCAGLRLVRRPRGISFQGRIGALIAAAAGARVACASGATFPEALEAPEQALLVSASDEDLEILRWALQA